MHNPALPQMFPFFTAIWKKCSLHSPSPVFPAIRNHGRERESNDFRRRSKLLPSVDGKNKPKLFLPSFSQINVLLLQVDQWRLRGNSIEPDFPPPAFNFSKCPDTHKPDFPPILTRELISFSFPSVWESRGKRRMCFNQLALTSWYNRICFDLTSFVAAKHGRDEGRIGRGSKKRERRRRHFLFLFIFWGWKCWFLIWLDGLCFFFGSWKIWSKEE